MSLAGSLSEYATLIFDCDGVVLDSNSIKKDAFYKATLPYGQAAAQAMVDHHVVNGGVSRYKKFVYFLEQLAPAYSDGRGPGLDDLLQTYACSVIEGLLSCQVAPGLESLRQQTRNARWLIVSGGDQAELRYVFARRGIAEWFDGGIFGSPDSKDVILARELAKANIQQPALFLGDTKYDYQVAKDAGLDFAFASGWSEVEQWEEWVSHMQIHCVTSLSELA